jgi:hypothetical protein
MSTYGNTGYDQLPADITVPYVTAVTANSLTGSKSAKSAKSSNKKSVNGASKKAAKSTAKTTSTPLVTSGAGQRQVLIDATGQLPPILISSGAPNPLEAARQQALQEVLAAIPAGAQQYIPGSASDPYMNTPGYQGVPYAGNAQVYGGSTIGTDPNAVTLGTPVGAGQPAGPQYYAPVIASRILNAWQDPNMSGNMTQANIDFLRNLT